MSHIVTARAPGKLVISGDYAVLEGAPAVVAAVDMVATVKITLANAVVHQLHNENTGQTLNFDGGFGIPIRWHSNPGAGGAMLEAALNIFLKAGYSTATVPAMRFSIDTQDFYANGKKKGIGSSAAVAVALTGALGILTRQKVGPDMALRVHREFQQDKGSGIDVISSWYGGVVCMTPGEKPQIEKLSWPTGLSVLAVGTGQPASTPAMLARLEAFREQDPTGYSECFTTLTEAAREVAGCWAKGELGPLLEQLGDYAQKLQALDTAAGIGIWSETHLRLAEAAAEAGVAYKPSGAGGGDFGLAFAKDQNAIDAFSQKAQSMGLGIEPPGWSETGLTTQPLNL